jgi:hypothetical protein
MISNRSNELKMAVVSDIHLGHRRNPTAEILKNLRAAFPDDATTAELDIIYLAGDVFDDLLSLPDDEVVWIKVWIVHFLHVCKKHDVMVRVLEGTPSHDWKQSKLFTTLNEVAGIGADLQYVTTLSIEYIQRHDIHVLYVPDEWDTTENTLSQVKDLLKAKGLTQVDYAIMHGQFDYQLPEHVKAPKHIAQEYLSLVRYLIFIGHVHVHSRFDRIVAQGSFDRLSHNEEGPKGHVRATVRDVDDMDVQFIENTGAKRFVTVKCTHMELDETLHEIAEAVNGLPDGSHVRVEASAENPILTNMEELIRSWPLLTWTKIARDTEQEEAVNEVEEDTPYIPIIITRDNLPSLLLERVARAGVHGNVLDAAVTILEEVM